MQYVKKEFFLQKYWDCWILSFKIMILAWSSFGGEDGDS